MSKVKEPKTKICSFCNNEITGNYIHIKTNRNTVLNICEKCMPKPVKMEE